MSESFAGNALGLDPKTDEIRISVLLPEYPRYAADVKIENLQALRNTDPFAGGVFSVLYKGSELAEAIRLIEALPPGQAIRCFVPGYTIEFFAEGNSSKKAAFCWQCNAVQAVDSSGMKRYYNFDAESECAVTLLTKLRQIVEANITQRSTPTAGSAAG